MASKIQIIGIGNDSYEDNKKERIHGVYIYKNQAFRIRENDWNSHCNVYKGKT